MTRIKMLLTLTAIVLGFMVMGSPAFALTYYPPITGFEDNDLDWHYDADQDGYLSEGDRLYGVLEFEHTFSVIPAGSESNIAPQELTGVVDLTIGPITALGGGFSLIQFLPTPGSTILDPLAPAGSMVSLYLDNVNDLDLVAANCVSDADCIDKANNGSHWMDLGFAGDADESWTSLAPAAGLDPALIQLGASTTKFGTFNYFVSVLTNNTGMIIGLQNCAISGCIGGDGLIQVLGSGDVLGGQGLTNGAIARSDTDGQIPTAVPEPSTLLLLGAGLLGLACRRMKR